MSKFKKGLFLGGLLGAGAMWLNTTKRGEELREQFMEHAEEVYDQAKEKVQESETYKELSEKDFREMVEDITDKYAEKANLGSMTKKIIVKFVSKQWPGIEAEIKEIEEKNQEDKDS